VVALAMILLWSMASGTSRESLIIGAVLAAFILLSGADACVTRTTIEVGRSELSCKSCWPLGQSASAWPARSVGDVYAVTHPPTVEIMLHGGEAVVLAYTATWDQAEDLAAAIRRGLRSHSRCRISA
jgi:hypothetical protein